MDVLQAMEKRHSVRSFTNQPIDGKIKDNLLDFIKQCGNESGLHLELVLDEPKAFDGFMAHYGNFSNVRNYIVLAGPKSKDLWEKCGYYGEKIVLFAQMLGLNTCWVALTYKKGAAKIQLNKNEKLCLLIAVGHGTTVGVPHKSKTREMVMNVSQTPPDWFIRGIDAALLAPTAMNQQKFVFSLKDNVVTAKERLGFYSKIDLGIVKYHFELGAGTQHFRWG